MTAPISIVERLPDAECRQSALEILDIVTDRVRNGQTVTVGIVEVRDDGSTTTSWSRSRNVNLLLGGLSYLQWRLSNYMHGKDEG